MVALNTNVAIAILNRRQPRPTNPRAAGPVKLPIPVVGELLFGAQNSGRREDNLKKYRSFIAGAELLVIDGLAAEHYAEIGLGLKQQGRPIPENDMWIAAICRANDVALFTYDQHFESVPGLVLVQG